MTTATHNEHYTETPTTEPVLFLAFELSEKTWKLGFTTGHGQKPRERTMAARDLKRLLDEVAQVSWPRSWDGPRTRSLAAGMAKACSTAARWSTGTVGVPRRRSGV